MSPTSSPTTAAGEPDRVLHAAPVVIRRAWLGIVIVGFLWLAFFNLTRFPATWFDEGSHLHVPKTLVTLGKYADYSDGELRYFGPTVGVGPTVMLPVAAAFKLLGVGLLQARLVMACYLLSAVAAFWLMARRVGGTGLALLSTFLLVTVPSISVIESGREVLGEVPGLFFLCAGLGWWFAVWEKPTWPALMGASVLLALACVTKHVYLISIGPGLVAAGFLDLIFYRRLPLRVFLVPLLAIGVLFGGWQVVLIAGLGPGTASENFRLFQGATRGAALVFSAENMRRAIDEVVSLRAIAGWVPVALLYAGVRQWDRDEEAQRLGVLWWMAVANLAWYVVASAGWPRYAFPGLSLSCVLVARLLSDVMPDRTWFRRSALAGRFNASPAAVAGIAVAVWVLGVSVAGLGRTAVRVAWAPSPTAERMAAYLERHVPLDRVIHTWDPEMSVFSDHRYRFPPSQLLIVAVAHQWTGGPAVTESYDFERGGAPEYVLEGPFSRYVKLYPRERLERDYRLVTSEGGYLLYARRTDVARF
ncbi:MAG: ArnT family glycosyltransferase [Vicinamibacterales bacterium]